ncbi:MAG: methylmalonyl-CoA mutase family protein [Mongoliitalea sp.]
MTQSLFESFPKVSKEEWIAQVTKDLKGKGFVETLTSTTASGLKIQPFFTAEDNKGLEFIEPYRNLNNTLPEIPGIGPRVWSNVHYVKVVEEQSANKRILEALTNGADAIRLELRGGENFHVLLKDVHLQYIQVFLDPLGSPVAILKEFLHYLKEIEFPADQLQGAYMWGGLVYALRFKNSLSELVEDAFQLLELSNSFQGFKVIGIVGTYYHNAGANAIQELAYAFASWMDLAERLIQKGVDVTYLASKTFVGTAVGSDFFEEIAKIKAYRIFFHQLLSLYKVTIDPASIFIYTSTSQWTKTQKDLHTNMIRNTSEAMAAVIGGCNALHVLPFDQATKEAEAFSLRMSRNISSILQEESYLNKVMDPTAGSYYIENLLVQLLEAAKDKLAVIEQEGGWWHLYASYQMQEEIKLTRQRKQQDVVDGNTVIVGVNKYPNKSDIPTFNSQAQEANWQILPSRFSLLSEL